MLIRRIFQALGLLSVGIIFLHAINHKSDDYFRSRALMLRGNRGQCSGEQIHTKAGGDYILTAAHCRVLADLEGNITVITERGDSLPRRVIAEDDGSDLLLLEGVPHLRGLDIATFVGRFEHVRTFTHGHGMPTYKTEGLMVGDAPVAFVMDLSAEACKGSKYSMETSPGFFGDPETVCVMSTEENVMTAAIVPGSSGGMIVNDEGQLVGVVSAGSPSVPLFGYIVRLVDIKAFLSVY